MTYNNEYFAKGIKFISYFVRETEPFGPKVETQITDLLGFSSKEEYLEWRKAWRSYYKEMSSLGDYYSSERHAMMIVRRESKKKAHFLYLLRKKKESI